MKKIILLYILGYFSLTSLLAQNDDQLNWTHQTVYGEHGEPIRENRSYFDFMGRALMTQIRDIETAKIIVTHLPVYDELNRPAAQMLPFATPRNDFGYYRTEAIGDFGPQFLQRGITTENYLANYYAGSNSSLEPDNPGTSFPYRWTTYYKDGSNLPRSTKFPGEAFHLAENEAKSGYSRLVPVYDQVEELKHYDLIRDIIIEEGTLTNLTKEVIIDGNSEERVIFSDQEGKVIAQAVSGPSNLLVSHTFSSEMPELIHVGKGKSYTFPPGFTVENVFNNRVVSLVTQGIYKVTGNGAVDGAPLLGYESYTYNFYDLQGLLVASMTPRGVEEIRSMNHSEIMQRIKSKEDLPFTIFFDYDFEGRIIAENYPDGGRSEYIYRTDGSLRFSQNAWQREFETTDSSRFNYVEYDAGGRPIEAGEFVNDGRMGALMFSEGLTDNVDVVGNDTDFYAAGREHWLRTSYDLPDPDFYEQTGLEESEYRQTFVIGKVSFMENLDTKTWYSYDSRGNVVWMVQKFKELNKVFSIDYTHDFLDNTTKVAFQKTIPSEAFYHFYEYDANQRLKRTSTHNEDKANEAFEQSAYIYYLHGPLKSKTYAKNLQKIDFFYTTDGRLKAINNPLVSEESDSYNDAFWQQLDYYPQDYVNQNGIGSVELEEADYPPQFTGNLRSVSWGRHIDEPIPWPDAVVRDTYVKAEEHARESIRLTAGYRTNGKSLHAYIDSEGADAIDPPSTLAATYDHKSQLTNAVHWKTDIPDSKGSYSTKDITYDKNGNILKIQRFGESAEDPIDNFSYRYDESNSDRLTAVENYVDHYAYNEIGQLVAINGYADGSADMEIAYTPTGKVAKLSKEEEVVVTYKYDDRDFRIAKIFNDYEIWYVRDAAGLLMATYERHDGGGLVQRELPMYGTNRIGIAFKDPTRLKYNYELTDHLGNVRAVVSALDVMANASMEADESSIAREEGQFENLHTRRRDALHDYYDEHHPAGEYVSYLNPSVNGEKVGPAKSVMVKPGDELYMEVFAQYGAPSKPFALAEPMAILPLSLGNTFEVAAEGSQWVTQFTEALAGEAALLGAGLAEDAPLAYLQYLLFDEQYTFVRSETIRIDEGKKVKMKDGRLFYHLDLATEITAEDLGSSTHGYLYAYVANESEQDVWYDDFLLSQIGYDLLKTTDYYPFGGVAKEWRNAADTDRYRFGYQGQFAEKDTVSGWNSFELRMYDARIGRWLSADPLKQHASLYLGMGNNPLSRVDPNGGEDKENQALEEVVVVGNHSSNKSRFPGSFLLDPEYYALARDNIGEFANGIADNKGFIGHIKTMVGTQNDFFRNVLGMTREQFAKDETTKYLAKAEDIVGNVAKGVRYIDNGIQVSDALTGRTPIEEAPRVGYNIGYSTGVAGVAIMALAAGAPVVVVAGGAIVLSLAAEPIYDHAFKPAMLYIGNLVNNNINRRSISLGLQYSNWNGK